ncbi:MAG TPA: hypothetical protein VN635_10535 [Conexibacter sp.]|nr:hypothetical protein [Conexibacter sp.]
MTNQQQRSQPQSNNPVLVAMASVSLTWKSLFRGVYLGMEQFRIDDQDTSGVVAVPTEAGAFVLRHCEIEGQPALAVEVWISDVTKASSEVTAYILHSVDPLDTLRQELTYAALFMWHNRIDDVHATMRNWLGAQEN